MSLFSIQEILARSFVNNTNRLKANNIYSVQDYFNAVYDSENDSLRISVEGGMTGAFIYKGSKATLPELPGSAAVGDTWFVESENFNYSWNGTQWNRTGSGVNLSLYPTTEYADNKYVAKVTGKSLSTNDYTNDEKTKVSKILTNGDGSKVLCNDGTYKTVSGGGSSLTSEQLQFVDWGKNFTINELANLKSYIDNYDYFTTYLASNFEIKEEILVLTSTDGITPVIMNIQGIVQNIDDNTNIDGDETTVYRVDISGYVLNVECYENSQALKPDRFYVKLVYDKSVGDYGTTRLYLTQDEYNLISGFSGGKNIIKVQYVQLKNNA